MVIEYKTAKLAKKVGFDTAYEFYDLEGNLQPFGMVGGWSKCNTKNYAAPTQSDLQKWLREVHNIDIFLYKASCNYYYKVEYNKGFVKTSDKNYVKYEKALEEGLYKALEILNERKDTAGNT